MAKALSIALAIQLDIYVSADEPKENQISTVIQILWMPVTDIQILLHQVFYIPLCFYAFRFICALYTMYSVHTAV